MFLPSFIFEIDNFNQNIVKGFYLTPWWLVLGWHHSQWATAGRLYFLAALVGRREGPEVALPILVVVAGEKQSLKSERKKLSQSPCLLSYKSIINIKMTMKHAS